MSHNFSRQSNGTFQFVCSHDLIKRIDGGLFQCIAEDGCQMPIIFPTALAITRGITECLAAIYKEVDDADPPEG